MSQTVHECRKAIQDGVDLHARLGPMSSHMCNALMFPNNSIFRGGGGGGDFQSLNYRGRRASGTPLVPKPMLSLHLVLYMAIPPEGDPTIYVHIYIYV